MSARAARGCYTQSPATCVLGVAERTLGTCARQPDVIVACGKAADVELIVEEPSLIAEVTSPSTRAVDPLRVKEAEGDEWDEDGWDDDDTE